MNEREKEIKRKRHVKGTEREKWIKREWYKREIE